MSVRVFGATVGAVLLSFALVSCAEEGPAAGSLNQASDTETAGKTDEPTPTPTETPTSEDPSPTETPTDEGQVVSEGDEVDAETSAAAESFLTDFLAAYDQAALDGDVSTVEKMYTEDCARCVDNVAFITDLYGQGRHLEGARHTELDFTTMGENEGAIMVRVQLVREAYTVEDDGGTEYDSGPAEPRTLFFRVTDDSGDWRVVNWGGDK